MTRGVPSVDSLALQLLRQEPKVLTSLGVAERRVTWLGRERYVVAGKSYEPLALLTYELLSRRVP